MISKGYGIRLGQIYLQESVLMNDKTNQILG